MRAAAAVTEAATVRVEGRGSAWLVRAPVLVVVSGQQLGNGSRSQWAPESRCRASRAHPIEARMWPRCCGCGAPLVVERPSPGFASWSGYAPGCGEQSLIAARSRAAWCLPSSWATRPASTRAGPRLSSDRPYSSDRGVGCKSHAAAGVPADRGALGGRPRVVAAHRRPGWSDHLRRFVSH